MTRPRKARKPKQILHLNVAGLQHKPRYIEVDGRRVHLRPDARHPQREVDRIGRLYEAHRDPFRAWETYRVASEYSGVTIPTCVSDYLKRVAYKLWKVSRAEPTGDRLLAAIADALEITGHGRGAVFARRKKIRDAQQLHTDVSTFRRRGHKLYQAIDYVAAFHKVHRSTVERAYQRIQAIGLLIPGGHTPSPNLPGY